MQSSNSHAQNSYPLTVLAEDAIDKNTLQNNRVVWSFELCRQLSLLVLSHHIIKRREDTNSDLFDS